MKSLNVSRELVAAERVLIDAIRITKLSNPSAMIGITEDDIDFLIRNIARDYLMYDFEEGKKILDLAMTQFFSLSKKESKITLGDFTRICHAENRQLQEFKKTQHLIARPAKLSTKTKGLEQLAEMRRMLSESNAIKPLLYDKNVRPFSHEVDPVPKGTPLKREDEITFFDPIWDQACYSDGPRLYEKCVAVGHIAPVESIKSRITRAVYQGMDRGFDDG